MARVTDADARDRLAALPQPYGNLAFYDYQGTESAEVNEDYPTACANLINQAIADGREGQLYYLIERAELIHACHSVA